MNTISICPGCGVSLSTIESAAPARLNASPACLALCHEVSLYTLSTDHEDFIHQLVVDAYAASHAGGPVKPITISFALIGLYLTFTHGYTGRRVQLAHMHLANKTKHWPMFAPPHEKAALTIQDVVNSSDDAKPEMIKKWAKSVWDMWTPHHFEVETLVKLYGDM